MKLLKTFILTATMTFCSWLAADACSRVVYLGNANEIILVARTLDWRNPIPTNIYVYPRGIDKTSMPVGARFRWKSKYGSVLAVSYDGGVTEGMNEAGLSMSGLFCNVSEYKTVADGSGLPVMSLAVIVSYFLDNFSTCDEVYAWLEQNPFGINGKTFDGGTVSLLHWALTDRSGTTLIMEYQDGTLKLYKDKKYQVLTNDPFFPAMQSINNYWDSVGGQNMLPGTVRSADRFARASFFIKHVPDTLDYPSAVGAISSVIGTVTVPYGYSLSNEPNLSSTQWRSIADITGSKYYFKFFDNTADFWVDLGRLSLHEGAPILKLDTTNHLNFSGCINDKLVKSKAFTPMW